MKNKTKKYINKVVDHLVNETKIEYDREKLYVPFFKTRSGGISYDSLFLPKDPHTYYSYFALPLNLSFAFSRYCKNMYGVMDGEIEYIWHQYRNRLDDKIKNYGY